MKQETFYKLVRLPELEKPAYFQFMKKSALFAVIPAIIILFFSFYLFYQFRFFIKAPEIVLESPSRDLVINQSFIEIKGRVEKDSLLTLNSRPIYINETGGFRERLNLAPGLNVLEFEAKNNLGKISKITRYIVVK